MKGWLVHLDKILAGLAALSALGEFGAFTKPWMTFVLALATFVSEFFKPGMRFPEIPLGQAPPEPPGIKPPPGGKSAK